MFSSSFDIKNNELSFANAANLIIKSDTIVVYRHENPDPDCLAAQMAMFSWLKNNFFDKKIYFVGENIPLKLFKFLKIKSFSKFNNPKEINNHLSIIMDTPVLERVDGKNFLEYSSFKIKFDHHVTKQNFCDIEIVDKNASSTSEIVCLFFAYMKDKFQYSLTKYISQILYMGLISDSSRFLYPTTNKNSYLIPIFLEESGLDKNEVHNFLYTKTWNEIQFCSFVMQNINLTKSKKVAYIILKKEYKKYELSYDEIKNYAHLLSGIEKVQAWVYSTYDENNQLFRLSLRSLKIPINKFAEKYNGGGHALACGIKCKSEIDVKKIIIELENWV